MNRWTGAALLLFMFGCTAAAADPWEEMFEQPLVKWALDIGDAKSLPWGDPRSWNGLAPGYDIAQAPGDALALLTPEAPVLARMETMRRLIAYSERDPRIAYQTLAALTIRAREADTAGKADVFASFDLGYFFEACRQAKWLRTELLGDMNGYSLVMRAIRTRRRFGAGRPGDAVRRGLDSSRTEGAAPVLPSL